MRPPKVKPQLDKAPYALVFSSPEGQAVLKDLQQRFKDCDLQVPNDPYGTHVNLGGHKLVVFIERSIENAD